MAKYDEETKQLALSLLHNGDDSASVSAKTGVILATVIRWKQQLKIAKEKGEVEKLLDMDKALLGQVIQGIADQHPVLEDAATDLLSSLESSQQLQIILHTTASEIITEARKHLLNSEHLHEVSSVADIICRMQESFFNSNSTQVNIQNNNGTPYSDFLTDTPEGIVSG